MELLKQLLNIDAREESFTKNIQKPKFYNKVKDNVAPIEDKNFMADFLFLPTTKEKFKYLLVVVDLATDEFDMEPMRDKNPENVMFDYFLKLYPYNIIHKVEKEFYS